MPLNIIDYRIGQKLQTLPFAALISAAMRKADSENADVLRAQFREIWDDLQARYNAGGGYLECDGDVNEDQLQGIVDNYLDGSR